MMASVSSDAIPILAPPPAPDDYIPAEIEREVRAAAGDKCEVCLLCERQGLNGYPWYLLQCHHIQPREMAGPTTPENLMLVCPTCHRLIQVMASIEKIFIRYKQIAFGHRMRRGKT
jgi:hypothetical protein